MRTPIPPTITTIIEFEFGVRVEIEIEEDFESFLF